MIDDAERHRLMCGKTGVKNAVSEAFKKARQTDKPHPGGLPHVLNNYFQMIGRFDLDGTYGALFDDLNQPFARPDDTGGQATRALNTLLHPADFWAKHKTAIAAGRMFQLKWDVHFSKENARRDGVSSPLPYLEPSTWDDDMLKDAATLADKIDSGRAADALFMSK